MNIKEMDESEVFEVMRKGVPIVKQLCISTRLQNQLLYHEWLENAKDNSNLEYMVREKVIQLSSSSEEMNGLVKELFQFLTNRSNFQI